MDDIQKALAAFGLTLVNVIVGAAASLAALRFFDNSSTADKWWSFFGGWVIAAWGAPPLRAYLEASEKVEILFVLLLGLFGMSVSAEIIKMIKDRSWRDFLPWNRRNGGGGGGAP